jgi:hypothetical protein
MLGVGLDNDGTSRFAPIGRVPCVGGDFFLVGRHDEHQDDRDPANRTADTVSARLIQSEPSLTDSAAHHSRALAVEMATEELGLSRPQERDTCFIGSGIHVRAAFGPVRD